MILHAIGPFIMWLTLLANVPSPDLGIPGAKAIMDSRRAQAVRAGRFGGLAQEVALGPGPQAMSAA
jgi:hypothetical protein